MDSELESKPVEMEQEEDKEEEQEEEMTGEKEEEEMAGEKEEEEMEGEKEEEMEGEKEEEEEDIPTGDKDEADSAEQQESTEQDDTKKGKDKNKKHQKSIQEIVGITQYAGSHKGFFGVIKQRYSDFQVNEMAPNGVLVELTDQTIIPEPEDNTVAPSVLPSELTPPILEKLDILVGIKGPKRLPVAELIEKSKQEKKSKEQEKLRKKKEEERAEEGGKSDGEGVEKEVKEEKVKEEKMEGDEENEGKEGEKENKGKEEEKENKGKEEEKENEGKEGEIKNDDEKNLDKDQVAVKTEDEVQKESSKLKNGEGNDVAENTEDDLSTQQEEQKYDDPNEEAWKHSKGRNQVLIDVEHCDKKERGNIHKAVKAKYKSLESVFDGKKYIVVTKKKSGSHHRSSRSQWPKSSAYTTFVMYKENMDTMEAVNHLAYSIGIKPNMFGYAGTKDKRAKTSQLVSVLQVAPRTLVYAARPQRRMQLGNFSYSATPKKLGQLSGNHFRIVLRDVTAEEEEVQSAIESLKQTGFVNYYGPQRFGTTSVATHVIGRELLKSNWHQAINLILEPRENDINESNSFRSVWKDTGDAEAALDALPRAWKGAPEARLLSGLCQLNQNDLVGAINRIPRNTRLLYLHAYQSYLWNTLVSRRIEKYGMKVLPGDIIHKKHSTTEQEQEGEEGKTDDEMEVKKERESDSEDDMEGEKTPEDNMEEEKDNEDEMEEDGNEYDAGDETVKLKDWNCHYLTEEEALTTDISEVLVPLPGYNVTYPQNEMKDWLMELLENDGLTTNNFNHKVKTFAVGGQYRKLIVRPTNISGSTCFYDDPTLPLIASDHDKLQDVDVEENKLEEGKHKAAIVEMTLPTSCYATIALRELLKMDTSSMFQSTLNPPRSKEDYNKRRSWERDSWRDGRGGRGGGRGRGDFRRFGGGGGGGGGGGYRGFRGGGRGGGGGGGGGGWWRGGGGYDRDGGGRGRDRGWGGRDRDRGKKRDHGGRDSWSSKRSKHY